MPSKHGPTDGSCCSSRTFVKISPGHASNIAFRGFSKRKLLGMAPRTDLRYFLPAVSLGLKIVGAAYLLYLGLKIFRSDPTTPSAVPEARGFLKLGALRFVNPKAWLMALTASVTYPGTLGGGVSGLVLMGALFTVVNLISNSAWALLGKGGSKMIRPPGAA